MNYKKKRVKSGLSTYTIAKELGIDWKKYQAVEEHNLALEGEYLNKFLNITDYKNAKMIKFNRRQKLNDIKEFIKDGKLKDLMAKRGYNGMSLASTLDIDSNVIKRVLDGKEASDDTNEYVYDFLQNCLNANTEEVTEEPKVEEKPVAEVAELPFYELKKLKDEKEIPYDVIGNAIGMPSSTISHILRGRSTSEEKYKKINDFIVNYTEDKKHNFDTELEVKIKQKGIVKAQIAKDLGINYAYVYNFLKGQNIKKEFADKIKSYIENYETNDETFDAVEIKHYMKVKKITMLDIAKETGLGYSYVHRLLNGKQNGTQEAKNKIKDFVLKGSAKTQDPEYFELNIEEINRIINDKQITYEDIMQGLDISHSYVEKLLHNRIINCNDKKRELDNFIRNFERQEITENSEPVAEVEQQELDFEDDELLIEQEPVIEEITAPIEISGVPVEDTPKIEKDYFDLLKENSELKGKLAKAEHQIEMYETLIDIIKGCKC